MPIDVVAAWLIPGVGLPSNPLDPFLQQRVVQITFGPPDVQTVQTQNDPALELSQFLAHLGQQGPVLEAHVGGDQTRDQKREAASD